MVFCRLKDARLDCFLDIGILAKIPIFVDTDAAEKRPDNFQKAAIINLVDAISAFCGIDRTKRLTRK